MKNHCYIFPQFRHVEGLRKLLDLRTNSTRIQLWVGPNNGSNVLEILRTVSNRFHDDEVFRSDHGELKIAHNHDTGASDRI